MFTKICKLERAPVILHDRKWMIHPCRSTRGPEDLAWKKPHSTYWLSILIIAITACLGWKQYRDSEHAYTSIFFFFYVIHHDYKAVRRLLLLLIVCLSSLKCDSGVMDNCTAILTTVSSILSFSSFNNVHYYCSHKRAPTNACPCRNHIRGGQCCPRSQPLTDRYGEGISAWPSVHCVAHRWLFFAPHQPRGPRENIKRWQSHRSGGGTWNDYLCIIRPQIWFCAYTFDPNAKPPFSFLNNHKQFLSFRCSVFVRTGCFRWY